MTPAELEFSALGFANVSTGGGCDCLLAFTPAGGVVCITTAKAANAPREMDERVDVGIYANLEAWNSGSEDDWYPFPTARSALSWVAEAYGTTLHPTEPPYLSYETGTAGHHVVRDEGPDNEPTILVSFPDDSPAFTPDGTWDPKYLRGIIRVLQAELRRVEGR